MSENPDKLQAHFEELQRRHRKIDNYLKTEYNNQTITPEVRIMKTQKLWLKDEMHRIQRKLNDS
jgi:uncharacterized protein YdcH (DUF465 family)